jgi:hypothetical protein
MHMKSELARRATLAEALETQPGFAFAAPLADVQQVGPTGAPHQGSSQLPAHASYTGAVLANKGRGEKVEALRQLLTHHGPLTLNECAVITGWPLSSICSLKSALGDQVVAVDLETQTWDDGRTTRRTRWGIR